MSDSDPDTGDGTGSAGRGTDDEDDEPSSKEPSNGGDDETRDAAPESTATADEDGDSTEELDRDALRQRVEESYDWENFGPREMRQMTPEEWDVAFDPDAWITGPELLDRVEKDLRRRVAERDVFAVIERDVENGQQVVVAYADEGFAVVYPDGTVEGSGTVLRDVKPTVALCSMPDYDVVEPPDDAGLPDPEDVPEGSGELGHQLLQAIAITQLGFGLLLFVMPFVYDPFVNGCARIPGSEAHQCTILGQDLVLFPLGSAGVVAALAGVAFVVFGVFMLVIVANARLSDRFRAEEFRERLRASGVSPAERRDVVSSDDQKD